MDNAPDQTEGLIEDDETMVFDPDFELEWEIGPDVESVFTPDET